MKVLTTAVIGAAAIVSARPEPEHHLQLSVLVWALAGLPSGVVLVLLSLAVTAAAPLRAVTAALRLLAHWRALPAGTEPFFWSLLVVLAEEGLFRLAAFAWLPPTWWSIGLVSIAFVLLHLPRIWVRQRPGRVALATFLLSTLLCVVFLATGSFWLAVTTHLVHNLVIARLRGALALAHRASTGDTAAEGNGR